MCLAFYRIHLDLTEMLRDGYFNLILPMRKLRQKCYRPTGPCHKQFPKSGLSDSSQPLVITTLPQRPHHDQDNEEMAQETTVFRFSSNALSSSKKVLLLRSFSRKEHRLLNSAGVTGTESGEIMNCFVWKCRGFFPGAVGQHKFFVALLTFGKDDENAVGIDLGF